MPELQPSVPLEAPKPARKTREKPVISPDDGSAISGPKKAVFLRLAKERVKERHSRALPELAEDLEAKTQAVEAAKAALKSVHERIEELTSAIVGLAGGRSLEDVRTSVESGAEDSSMLAAMIPLLDALNPEREEAERALSVAEKNLTKKTAPKRLSATQHEAVLSSIELETREIIRGEEQFEALFVAMQSGNGNWEKREFEGFVPYLEQTYLTPGAVANLVLKRYAENEALPASSQMMVNSFVDTLVRRQVAEKVVQSGLTDLALRDSLQRALFERENTADMRKKLVVAYLADTSPTKEPIKFDGPEAARIAVREIALREGKAGIDELRFVLATFAIAMPNVGSSHLPRFMDDNERRVITAARDGSYGADVAPEGRAILDKHGVDWNGPSRLMKDAMDILYSAEAYSVKLTEAEGVIEKVIQTDWTVAAKKRVDLEANERADRSNRRFGKLEKEIRAVTDEIGRLKEEVDLSADNIKQLALGKAGDFNASAWNKQLDSLYSAEARLRTKRATAPSFELGILAAESADDRVVTPIAPIVQQICEEEHRYWKDLLPHVVNDALPILDVANASKVLSMSEIYSRVKSLNLAVAATMAEDTGTWWTSAEGIISAASSGFIAGVSSSRERSQFAVKELRLVADGVFDAFRHEALPSTMRQYLKDVVDAAVTDAEARQTDVTAAEQAVASAKTKKEGLAGGFFSGFRSGAKEKAEADLQSANTKLREAKGALADARKRLAEASAVQSRCEGDWLAR